MVRVISRHLTCRRCTIVKPIVVTLAIISGAMLWQIYKYTQAIEGKSGPSVNQVIDQAQETKELDDGLEEVEPELYEKPASLKLDN